jgi:hypothetical protein
MIEGGHKMLLNLYKNIAKIVSTFDKMSKMPKMILKYGCIIFLAILFAGTVLVLLNNKFLSYDSYLDLVSKSIVKISFSIAAEAIIGSLILDYVFKK